MSALHIQFTTCQAACGYFLHACPYPAASPLNLTGWFAKPKPNPLPPPKQLTGERLKVLHLSDLHIDPSKTLRLDVHTGVMLIDLC